MSETIRGSCSGSEQEKEKIKHASVKTLDLINTTAI